ncbi:MAG: RidA family protein [Hyphomonadaceae bacterium]
MLRKFNPDGAADPGVYSHGVEASGIGRMLFVSGQVGVRKDGSVPEDVAEQTRVAIGNLKDVLAGADMTIADVAKYTIYLTDQAHMGDFMAGGASALSAPPPAATLLIVKGLANPALKIEIEAIAVK